MTTNYARPFCRRATPQSEPIPGSTQVANSAGGYAWQVDDWTRFDRFLVLGAEGGTYYIGERDLVKENHDALVRCIQGDGARAVHRIVEISDSGRAPKNDPAIFRWILSGANGLGERTVTRRVQGERRPARYAGVGDLPAFIQAFEQAKKASSKAEIVKLVTEHDLPREAIPTQWLDELEVWDALLQRMPMTAMIRNLGKMTSLGLLDHPFNPVLGNGQSAALRLVLDRLGDRASLRGSRLHPFTVLVALKTYALGRGDKGGLTWRPLARIVDALDAAFYTTFRNVEPCGKPVLLALSSSLFDFPALAVGSAVGS